MVTGNTHLKNGRIYFYLGNWLGAQNERLRRHLKAMPD
jgi:Uri superfamily endonuclease